MNFESNVKQTEGNGRFREECKVIDLKYEYCGYTGEERYAIVSELSEEELKEKYPEIIRKYIPFVLLSVAQGAVIDDFNRNEKKHQMRRTRCGEAFGYEEGITETVHSEVFMEDYLEVIAQRETREEEIRLLNQALSALPVKQRDRVIKFYHNITARAIAEEEGVHHSAVDKSIRKAIESMKKWFCEEGIA